MLKKGSIINNNTCDNKRYKKDLVDLVRSSYVESKNKTEYCAVHEIVFKTFTDANGKKQKDKNEFLMALVGQKDTIYENSIMVFGVSVKGKRYPWEGPEINAISLFFHPNIKENSVCLDILKGEWKPTMTLSSLAQSLVSFLIAPNDKDPLNFIINDIYKKNPNEYEKYARYISQKYMNMECYEIIKNDFIHKTNEYEELLPFGYSYYDKADGDYQYLMKIMNKLVKKNKKIEKTS